VLTFFSSDGEDGEMVRLAALGLMHEANTFAPSRVDLAAFEADGILRGQQIVDRHVNARTTMAGFLAAASGSADVEVVPLLFTTVTPAGPITAEALHTLADELVALLASGGPWDGVLAALHGAAVAEDCDDVDGYLLERFRSVVGAGTPIGAALDLHANVSQRMAEHADLLVTYRTNPHVDAKERALEVAALVVAAARGEVVPTQVLVTVPAVIDILRQNTDASPMREILGALSRTLDTPGVLTASVAEGYPYADVPELGMSVVVVADGDAGLARREADALARFVLDRRAALRGQALAVPEAVRRARGAAAGPVLLLDVGDNIGAGAPGDSVVLLDAARHLGLRNLLCILDDPDAVARCWQAGVGTRVELRLGARWDPSVGPPLEAFGTVRGLSLGRYEDAGATHAGQRHFDSGRTAVVALDEGQTVVLTSRPVMPSALAQLTSLGLDPVSFQAIVAKGVHSPLAAYGPIATEVLFVDTPGVTSADLGRFTYRKAQNRSIVGARR
jgi:microcystin degradation protein MlrC